MKKYDLAVYIGRFQPLHVGHLHILEKCDEIAETTLVLVGSSSRPRTIKNPFSYGERAEMLHSVAYMNGWSIMTAPLPDFIYSDHSWITHIQETVYEYIEGTYEGRSSAIKVALVGHFKDDSSYYLNYFPEWDLVEVDNYLGVNATDIRNSMFSPQAAFGAWTHPEVPGGVMSYIRSLAPVMEPLIEEKAFVDRYKKAWEAAPYAPTFVTADAVVIHSDHVLLVKRKGMPGKGLWALPGGFLDQNETLLQCAMREASEETGVHLLKQWVFGSKTFDHPGRSTRGRTITHAVGFYIPQSEEASVELAAGDDAAEAKWVSIKHLDSSLMYEDHYDIIHEVRSWL